MDLDVSEVSHLGEWEQYLYRFPASVFITSPWLEALRGKNLKPIYLRITSRGKTIGLIAGLEIIFRHPLINRLGRLLFFFSGPSLLEYDTKLSDLSIKALIRYAISRRYSCILIKSWDYPYPLSLDESWLVKFSRMEYVIDLEKSILEITNYVRSSIKRKVRSATNSGLSFHVDNPTDSLKKLMCLLEETRKYRISKGYVDYSPFYMPFVNSETLLRMSNKENVRIYTARRKNRILSAVLLIVHSKRAYAILNGTSTEGYKFGANPFLFFNVLIKLKEENFSCLNLGGLPSDFSRSSLAFYKRSFGADEMVCEGGISLFLTTPLKILNVLRSPARQIRKPLKQTLTNVNAAPLKRLGTRLNQLIFKYVFGPRLYEN